MKLKTILIPLAIILGGLVAVVLTADAQAPIGPILASAPLIAPSFTGPVNVTGTILGTSDIQAGVTGAIYWSTRTKMLSAADGSIGITNLAGSVGANVNIGAITTFTNCSSSAAPAVCGVAAAGSVVVAAAATTVTVNTTAVTANSQIFVMYDSSLGSKLSVTCNTTEPALYGVTARTAATSFVITSTAPVTNPACFSYFIVN